MTRLVCFRREGKLIRCGSGACF